MKRKSEEISKSMPSENVGDSEEQNDVVTPAKAMKVDGGDSKEANDGVMPAMKVDAGDSEEANDGGMPAMEADDAVSPLDDFEEGLFYTDINRLAHADFFNSFEDDFDDEDIN